MSKLLEATQMKCGPCDLIFFVESKPDTFPFELRCPNCCLQTNYMGEIKMAHDDHLIENAQKGQGDIIIKRKVNTIKAQERADIERLKHNKLNSMLFAAYGIFITTVSIMIYIMLRF